MLHKTKANIDWVKHSLAATAKIIGDQEGFEYLYKKGYSPEEIRRDFERILNGSGFMGKSHVDNLVDFTCYLLEDFKSYFIDNSTHNGDIGYALIHRARWTLQKNETDRFLEAEWAPFYDLVVNAVEKKTPITPHMRYAAHEKRTEIKVAGKPGVYVRTSPERDWVYVGEGADLKARNRGHSNSPLYLERCYVTGSKKAARDLEQSIFHILERKGLIEYTKGNGSVGRRGPFMMTKGVDPIAMIDTIVAENLIAYCRTTSWVGKDMQL